MGSVARDIRVARASRVLATASSLSRTFLYGRRFETEDRFGETPKPARETRVLPGSCCHAFTLIELLVVMAIIIILAGLVVATTGYVQEKGKRSRTEAEIAAISAALENYKADNGIYPPSIDVDAKADWFPYGTNKPAYESASQILYVALTGDENKNRSRDSGEDASSYMNLKPNMLSPNDPNSPVTAIRDPFGNSYGYSTINQTYPAKGYNPTFDLWSSAGERKDTDTDQSYLARWLKNW